MVASAIENGLNPFEYLAWIFKNAPNMGKPGNVSGYEEFVPGSESIPKDILTPQPKNQKKVVYAWEEDKQS
jgi:hypothetical protein